MKNAQAPDSWSRSLLDGFRQGSREALTQIYRLHAAEVARTLRHGFTFAAGKEQYRFTGYTSEFELQDALHETFRRVFEPQARLGYDGLRPFGPYIATVARNLVLRSFRVRQAFVLIGDPEGPERAVVSQQPVPEPTDYESDLDRGRLHALVRRFLEAQSADDRRIIDLRFVDGLSQERAALELGLGRQRLRGREVRLKRSLLDFLRAHDKAHGAVAEVIVLSCALIGLLMKASGL